MAFDPLSIFTGSATDKAAEQQRAYFDQQSAQNQAQAKKARELGIGALQAGQTGGLAAIQGGTGTGRNDIIQSTGSGINTLYGGQDLGAGALTGAQTGGLAALQSGVQQAQGGYAPLADAAARYSQNLAPAAQMSANALGLNGPEGNAAAAGAFQAGPGFQFALNQGLESIGRNANAAGMGAGGNAMREAQTFGQGLAQQEYDKWAAAVRSREGLYGGLESQSLANLGTGTSNAALTGGTGAANIYTGTGGRLADVYTGTGKAGAGLYQGAGQSLADLASKGGLAEAGLYGSTGANTANLVNSIYGTQTGLTSNMLKPYADTYQQEAAGTLGGAKNLFNLGGQLATFGASGGLSGLGSGLFSGLSNNFMSPGSFRPQAA